MGESHQGLRVEDYTLKPHPPPGCSTACTPGGWAWSANRKVEPALPTPDVIAMGSRMRKGPNLVIFLLKNLDSS